MNETYRRLGADDLEHLLLGKTSKLKDITINLGNEIKLSNNLINGLNDDFEKNNSFIRKLLGNLNKLPKFSDCKLYFYICLFALFVFCVLYFLIKFK
jgi:blocked-early-in-transport protein 1